MTTVAKTPNTFKTLLQSSNTKKRLSELLDDRSEAFTSSLLDIVNSNGALQKCHPQTILTAAMTAAVLDLPINKNLGFAWIVPYKGRAQFQMGYKGYIQLALRTGQYKNINVIEVYENQFVSFNPLTEEIDLNFKERGKGKIAGFAAYFKLVNGMEKTIFWYTDEVVAHAKKYSQSYSKANSQWKGDGFVAMAKKTLIKALLSKWGILTVQMQTAQLADQSTQLKENQYIYEDNPQEKNTPQTIEVQPEPQPVPEPEPEIKEQPKTTVSQDKTPPPPPTKKQDTEATKNSAETSNDDEAQRIRDFIKSAKTRQDLIEIRNSLPPDKLKEFEEEIIIRDNEIVLEDRM